MQRLYDFLRRHPTWVDSFWAVVLFGLAGVSVESTDGVRGHHGGYAESLILSAVLCVVVALRRRVPERMLLLTTAVGLAQLVLDVEPTAADFAMLVIVYTVAANGARWASRFALAVGFSVTLFLLTWLSVPSWSTKVRVAVTVFVASASAVAARADPEVWGMTTARTASPTARANRPRATTRRRGVTGRALIDDPVVAGPGRPRPARRVCPGTVRPPGR